MLQFAGPAVPKFDVRYRAAFHAPGSGKIVRHRGARLLRVKANTTADPRYTVVGEKLANVRGYKVLRDVVWGGSSRGQSYLLVGLPRTLRFRAVPVRGPGAESRLIIDVAHR